MIRIKQATKSGYIEMVNGGVCDLTYPSSKTRRGRVQANGLITPTITAEGELHKVDKTNGRYRIRKLTPKECWRLMGFTDEDFNKAKWITEETQIVGGEEKCNAKLKVVQEKLKPNDMATYVSCTTKDTKDMEILKTIALKSALLPESESRVPVSIVIERLGEQELSECATSITKCIDFMGMHFTLIDEREPYLTDIIVRERKGNTNTGKCMRITTQSNYSQDKLYTILTLIALIIESKIFTSTIQQANICGFIAITENSAENVMLKISNLEMECISERISNTNLYKQAGNSIVVPVLEEIFKNLLDTEVFNEQRNDNSKSDNGGTVETPMHGVKAAIGRLFHH